MNLDYLKTFLELVKLGSFSAVAKKLNISQPAVSFQIQKLEHDLGVRILNRNQKKVSLTDAGRRLMDFAKSVDGEEGRLIRDLDRLRQEISGELLIAASTTPGELILPMLLGEFLSLHPAVKAQVVVRDSMEVIAGVRNGTYEVGFCGAVPTAGQGVEWFKIAEDDIVLIVFPEHPFATRKKVTFSEVQEEAIIAREPTSGTQKSLETLLSNAGLDAHKLKPRLMLGSAQAIVSAVEARAGIAFISSLAIKKSLELGTVRQVSIDKLPLKRDFFCVYYGEVLNSRLMQEFITFIRAKQ
jgi:DNA-binding transcriptional LysR family regulator